MIDSNRKIVEIIRTHHAMSAMRDNPKFGDQRLFDAATSADADRATLLGICEELLSQLASTKREHRLERDQHLEAQMELRETQKRLQKVATERDALKNSVQQ